MAASSFVHSWSPHADYSASFVATSRSQLALYLHVRPFHQLRTHRVATGGELTVRPDSLTSCPGRLLSDVCFTLKKSFIVEKCPYREVQI